MHAETIDDFSVIASEFGVLYCTAIEKGAREADLGHVLACHACVATCKLLNTRTESEAEASVL